MTRSSRTLLLLAALALTAFHGSATADGLEQHFDGSFPPTGWTTIDYAGDGVEWLRNTSWGDGNWTGGASFCAEVSSAHSIGLSFDAGLLSPEFVVPAGGLLFFRANYQNFKGNDSFDVIAGFGGNEMPILTWTSDQGGFESLPGAEATISMPPVLVGQTITLEFRYRDNAQTTDNYYIQIDDVIVGDESAVRQARWGAIKALYR